MKLELNTEYKLKDNKGYIMAVDQNTSFKTIINFIGDYDFEIMDMWHLYLTMFKNELGYIHLNKQTGYAFTNIIKNLDFNLKNEGLEIEE